jgi:hypothetical protein
MHDYRNPEYPPDIDVISVKILIPGVLHQTSGEFESGNDPAGKK